MEVHTCRNPDSKAPKCSTRNFLTYVESLAAVVAIGLLLCCCCPTAAAAAQQYQDRPLQLPTKPEEQCGSKVFNRFTKQHRTCAIHFYHRQDPDAECCEALALWYGPKSILPSRNCYCHKETWQAFQAVVSKTYYEFDTMLKICTAMGFHVPFYQEDENGTATGTCTGAPFNATEYAGACMDNCPKKPRATLDDWSSRLHQDPLVLTSLVFGAISSVGALLLVAPSVVDITHSLLSMLNLQKSTMSIQNFQLVPTSKTA